MPRLIRSKPASAVKQSKELREFLESCLDEELKGQIEVAFTDLQSNYQAGDKVPQYLWPKYYAKRWGINNLYVYRLGRYWRLTYFLDWPGEGVEVICLEILMHGDYDNRFGYRTS